MVGESPSSPAQPAAQAGVPPTELVVLASQSVLQTVVTNLDLVDKWGRRYNAVGKLPASASPVEAAELANAVAAAYIGYNVSIHSPLKARFLESAVPAARPARPNKPLNLLLGVVIGLLLGTGTGCLCGIWLTTRKRHG
jgi:uncharacterized protein involved in exopolysaccharide biosynthesis